MSASAELKAAGAREVYVFGSVVRGKSHAALDIDLAVSGLPPGIFYHTLARVCEVIDRDVDLVDLDKKTPFIDYLRAENDLVRVG